MTQLTIDLPYRAALGRADFQVSDCNAAALGWVERWPDWPNNALVLHGPADSGKSHLARIWSDRSGAVLVAGNALHGASPGTLAAGPAVAVDGVDGAPELALLHLFNCCTETGAGLLLVARTAATAWPIELPDLASRLRAAPSIGIGPPDDALLAAVLVKHFSDRQIRVAPGLIDYLVPRMERSFAAAAALAEKLDRLVLGTRRPLGIALARRALAE